MKTFFLLFTLSFFVLMANAQSLTEVARSNQLTWYGIDFSQVRLSGFTEKDFESKLPELIKKGSYAPMSGKRLKWFRKRLEKDEVLDKTEVSQNRNAAIDPRDLIIKDVFSFDLDKVKNIVAEYKANGKGYGLLIIAEFFNDKAESVQFWAAFINNETGKLITARRYTAKINWHLTNFNNRWFDAIETAVSNVCSDLRRY